MRKKQSTDAEMTLFGNDGGESTMTITQLCDAVQQLLKSPTVTDKWVVGELIDFSVRNGHCYADLVEKDDEGKALAKIHKYVSVCLQFVHGMFKNSLYHEKCKEDHGTA